MTTSTFECIDPDLRSLKLTYELVKINEGGTLQPVVHAPMHNNKKKILQMWFNPAFPLPHIRSAIEKMLIKMYL